MILLQLTIVCAHVLIVWLCSLSLY